MIFDPSQHGPAGIGSSVFVEVEYIIHAAIQGIERLFEGPGQLMSTRHVVLRR